MEIQPATYPADDYQTTTTSCTCLARTELRPHAPCRHMRALIVRNATDALAASVQDDTRWSQRRDSNRRDRERRDRRELRREREAA